MELDGLLLLARWLSPSYPTGGFAFSAGLETAIAEGQVSDAASLQGWLGAVLVQGQGRTDAILLHAAHAAAPEALPEIAALAAALAPTSERLAESLQQGAAFAATTRAAKGYDLPDMAYPVAVGRAARLAGAPAVPACALYLQSVTSGFVQAALRLMPLGQTRGAAVMEALAAETAALAQEAAALTLDDLGTCAFGADIASMRHETLSPRLFRS